MINSKSSDIVFNVTLCMLVGDDIWKKCNNHVPMRLASMTSRYVGKSEAYRPSR